MVAGAGVFLLTHQRASADKNAGSQDHEPHGPRAVPVVAQPVQLEDVPIVLDGLGNVVAYKTVAVRPQVDGRLDKVLFREGQEVHRGEVLAQIDPRPFQIQLHQAQGALARDTATLEGNQHNLDRYTSLRSQKLVADQQVDDQRATVGQYQGSVLVDQAQIESAKLSLDYARITSPIDGFTGVRLVDPGNFVHAADTTGIVVITQLDPIAVMFTLPEDDLPAVAEHLQAGPLSVEVYARDGETRLGTGQLELIDNQINQATATIRLKAVFPNPKHVLWPNLFVKARLHVETRKAALVVPNTVVQRGPRGVFAYVVKPDNTVEARPIEVELIQGELTILRSGLQAGEQVVVDGQNQLKPGAHVQLPGAAAHAAHDPHGPDAKARQ